MNSKDFSIFIFLSVIYFKSMISRAAHAPTEEELNKFSSIVGNENISIAEYSSKDNGEDLQSFRHNHDTKNTLKKCTFINN